MFGFNLNKLNSIQAYYMVIIQLLKESYPNGFNYEFLRRCDKTGTTCMQNKYDLGVQMLSIYQPEFVYKKFY